MSFGILDTIFDKFLSPTKGIDIPKKFTGSQSFMPHSFSYQNIPPDFKQSFHGADFVNPCHQLTTGLSLDSKMDLYHILERSNTLVSKASKLLFPPKSAILSDFHTDRSYSDVFPLTKMALDQTFDLFFQEKQRKESSPKKGDKFSNSPQPNIEPEISPKKMKKSKDIIVSSVVEACPPTKTHKKIDIQALNQELNNRKTKELNKRSKKRRRRQKQKTARTLPKPECLVETPPTMPSPISSPGSSNRNRDIFCDFLTLSEEANSVQILLPRFSSFMISVESDDSEWENNSDCEWLTDCSEFEFSGLFVSNLAAPHFFPSNDDCTSQLNSLFNSDDEQEIRLRKKNLQKVNQCWTEATQGLDEKPKLSSKVSFAPDDRLVQIKFVDFCERKGEWETYATERLRFKKRIEEVEKILSPCLLAEHREKVLQRTQLECL